MKKNIAILFLATLLAQFDIEGRWHIVGYEDAVMYQFVDNEPFANAGNKYTIYSIDGHFDDLEGDSTGGTPHPYSIVENIITIDSLLGQNSIVQAKEFNKHVPIDGAILTKLDGTAKGGIIFSLHKEIGIPVQFIGVGEELSDFEVFDPEKYVNGLIGVENGN